MSGNARRLSRRMRIQIKQDNKVRAYRRKDGSKGFQLQKQFSFDLKRISQDPLLRLSKKLGARALESNFLSIDANRKPAFQRRPKSDTTRKTSKRMNKPDGRG
jgi:hypothetical protein